MSGVYVCSGKLEYHAGTLARVPQFSIPFYYGTNDRRSLLLPHGSWRMHSQLFLWCIQQQPPTGFALLSLTLGPESAD